MVGGLPQMVPAVDAQRLTQSVALGASRTCAYQPASPASRDGTSNPLRLEPRSPAGP